MTYRLLQINTTDQGEQIADCDKIDGATTVYVKFAKERVAKNDTTSGSWKTQTEGYTNIVSTSASVASRNALGKINRELKCTGENVVSWIEVVIFALLARIVTGVATLQNWVDW